MFKLTSEIFFFGGGILKLLEKLELDHFEKHLINSCTVKAKIFVGE